MSILKSYEEMPHRHMRGAKRYAVPISNDGSHYLSVIVAPGYFDGYEVALLQPGGFVKHPLISSGLDDVARFEEVEEVDNLIETLRLEWGYKE